MRYVFAFVLALTLLMPYKEVESQEGPPSLLKGDFIWHWHISPELDSKSLELLKDYGLKGIFFRAGHFYLVDSQPYFKGIKFTNSFLRELSNLGEFQVHLVFTFENSGIQSFVQGYFQRKPEEAINYIQNTIQHYLNIFEFYGVRVAGIQLDMEGDLDWTKYKRLIEAAAKRFGKKHLISITPQSNWLNKDYFKDLVAQAHFLVPMLYDYLKSYRVEGSLKVTDFNWIFQMVKELEELNMPFYAGIPTYSYSVIYNERGERSVSWAGVSFEDVAENPDFVLLNSYSNKSQWVYIDDFSGEAVEVIDYNGDNIYEFEAIRDNRLGKRGTRIKFDQVNPLGVKRYIEIARKAGGENFLGVALFRLGAPGETKVLNAYRLAKVYKEANLHVQPLVEVMYRPKSPLANDFIDISFILRNIGDEVSNTSNEANLVKVRIGNAEIISVERGDFDTLAFKILPGKDSQNFNSFELREKHLGLAEVVISGPITLKIKGFPVVIEYSAQSQSLDERYYDEDLKGWRAKIYSDPEKLDGVKIFLLDKLDK